MQKPVKPSIRSLLPLVAGVVSVFCVVAWALAVDMGYGTSTSTSPVRLVIGDTVFSIPKNYIWSRESWRGGKTDGVNLHALLPRFEPYTEANSKEFETPGRRRKILLVLGEHSTDRHPAAMSRELVFERQMKGARFHEVDAPHGLKRVVVEGKSPAELREHFISRLRDGSFYIVSCWPDRPGRFPSCTCVVEYTKQTYVQYTFPKRLLSDWQAIEAGVLALIKRFEAKGAAK